jgi:predicted small lipoprotein YifL
MKPRPTIPVLLIAATLLLSACGNKGPLTLPPKDGAPQQVKSS